MLPRDGERPPPGSADSDLSNERLGKRLDNNHIAKGGSSQPEAAPSEAALDIVDHERFDVLVEAATLAVQHAQRVPRRSDAGQIAVAASRLRGEPLRPNHAPDC
jgi:hypothetical protein